ncbi:MAG: helix-turn-helix domain-containing protein [Oscillospiraceae bacterium]
MEEFRMPLKENFQELIQHGKADFPIQYYVNSLHIAGNNVPLHWHPNPEFFVVHSGRVHVQAGNSNIILEQGEGIFLNTNCLHSYESCGGAPCYCPNVVFQPEFIAPVNSLISNRYVMPLTLNSQLPYVVLDRNTDWKRSILERLDRVFSMLQSYGEIGSYGESPQLDYAASPGERECFEMRVQCEINRAWELLYSHRGEMELAPAVKNEHVLQIRMQKMIGFIQNHYAEDVSLQDIANSASISRSEASRCFQSYLHTSPVNYLLKYRVERSMQLLRDNNMTVEAVALECGFSSSAYFCKIFRTHTGMTPKQYRSK